MRRPQKRCPPGVVIFKKMLVRPIYWARKKKLKMVLVGGVKKNVPLSPPMVSDTLKDGSTSRCTDVVSDHPLPKSSTRLRSRLSYTRVMLIGSPGAGTVKSVMLAVTRPGL